MVISVNRRASVHDCCPDPPAFGAREVLEAGVLEKRDTLFLFGPRVREEAIDVCEPEPLDRVCD